jgi:hypothetical protein
MVCVIMHQRARTSLRTFRDHQRRARLSNLDTDPSDP